MCPIVHTPLEPGRHSAEVRLPFKQFTCYPHCVHSNYMPSVSMAEGVHIGTRSATSAVRLSFSHRESPIDFYRIQNFAHTIETSFLLLAVAIGTMCDSSP